MPKTKSVLPPLVLLPGTWCDERLFVALLDRLRGCEQLSTLETRTILTTGCNSLKDAAEQVLAATPARFAVLGFSLGGLVALETALQARDRIAGLALLNVNAAPVPREKHAGRREALRAARALGPERYVREHLWPTYVGPASQQNGEIQALLAGMAEDLGDEVLSNQTEAALGRPDYRLTAGSLALPTLIVAGAHDAICPPSVQRELAEAMPQSTFTMIEDAGHFALLEQPDAVAASVAAWLNAVGRHAGGGD